MFEDFDLLFCLFFFKTKCFYRIIEFIDWALNFHFGKNIHKS